MLYEKPRLVIYHGQCFDGTTAAWLLWNYFGSGDTDYCPCIYGPKNPFPETKAKEIYIVDYSFARPTMEQALKDGKDMILIDHHKTAIEELSDMPGIRKLLNVDKSGASLTLQYMLENLDFTRRKAPSSDVLSNLKRFAYLVEDRDLFRFADPRSKAFTARQSVADMTFDGWSDLFADFSTSEDQFVKEGSLILAAHNTNIAKFIENNLITLKLFGHTIPMLNVPKEYGSDACHELLRRMPESPFAMYYYDDALSYTKGSYIGIRARNGSPVSVDPLARRFEGGGHAKAAAFRTTLDRVRMLEHDMNLWEQMCPGGKFV